jgi:hypothetical protein
MDGKGVKALLEERPVDPEVKEVLKVVDELLGKLPEDVIEKFSKTSDYELYCMVLDRYGVG